jgi:hypothetical protein
MSIYTVRAIAALVAVLAWLTPGPGETSALVDVFATGPSSGPTEDSPQWDCRIHGNRICGPGNAQNVPAGYYFPAGWLDYSDDFGA